MKASFDFLHPSVRAVSTHDHSFLHVLMFILLMLLFSQVLKRNINKFAPKSNVWNNIFKCFNTVF